MDLTTLLEESGAILRGHFLLTSGRHSDVYFEKFRVLERPDVLSALCGEVARHYRDTKFDFVAGPTTGGIIIAFEVARQMGLPAVYIESVEGKKTLRRGKTLASGSRCLLVDDVLTTGTSLLESRTAIQEAGGDASALAVLINRAAGVDLGLPLFSAYQVEAKSFAPDEVPSWLAEIPIVKPGTRAVTA
jgi:orotate phosphoribosyltransferase